jgi:hypothetical protein
MSDGTFKLTMIPASGRVPSADCYRRLGPLAAPPAPEQIAAAFAAPLPAPVPESVGPAQLRIALLRLHGITDGAIYAAINAAITDPQAEAEARIFWGTATVMLRSHPLLPALAAAFGLSPAQVDEVFRLAATI